MLMMTEQYLSDVHVYQTFYHPNGGDFAYTRFEFSTSPEVGCTFAEPVSGRSPRSKKHRKLQRKLCGNQIPRSTTSFSTSVMVPSNDSHCRLSEKCIYSGVGSSGDPEQTGQNQCLNLSKESVENTPDATTCGCVRFVRNDLDDVQVDPDVHDHADDNWGGGGDSGDSVVSGNVDDGGDIGGGEAEDGDDDDDNDDCGGCNDEDDGADEVEEEEDVEENDEDYNDDCTNSTVKVTNVNQQQMRHFSDDELSADNESLGRVYDDDDDVVVRRKRPRSDNSYCFHITIKHSLSTNLANVGMQVWMGALFLSDYMLHSPETFRAKTVLDLGAGAGLTSMMAGLFARDVYCTDVGDMILTLARDNVARAMDFHTLPRDLCPVRVRELDWFSGLKEGNGDGEFSLTADDMHAIRHADIVIAADVIYDCDMIDAFFRLIRQLGAVPDVTRRKFLISLEKRFVFTIEDLDVTSPAYNYFRSKLLQLEPEMGDVRMDVAQLSSELPKYFRYERPRHLELWEITTRRRQPSE